MKKSKFLKKSLAMLLALMLVVAMIPLSASAASSEGPSLIYVDDNTVALPEEKKLDKNCELVHEVKKWVDAEYESGRVTVLTDEELLKVIDDASKKLGILLV